MTTAQQLVDAALAEVSTLSVEQAQALLGQRDVQFVDIREGGELRSEGRIPGAFHAPRGLLEFWVDPQSPWHQSEIVPGARLVLYCAAGLRSALAVKALQDMGIARVCHLGGGFEAWRSAGAPVLAPP